MFFIEIATTIGALLLSVGAYFMIFGRKSNASDDTNTPDDTEQEGFFGSLFRKKSRRRKKNHRIKSGDSLGKIAKKYGVSISALIEVNDIENPNNIKIGQTLIIPNKSGNSSNHNTEKSNKYGTYTVKSGDFLSTIASRYGLRTSDLMRANNITNPDNLRVGQVLTIPSNATKPKNDKPNTKPNPDRGQSNYTVKSGDFLSTIASRYGLRTSDLMRANDITNPDSLRVGQVLIIPGNATKPKDDKPDNKPNPDREQSNYTVKSGDFLSTIASRYGLRTSDLMRANNITNPDSLRVGQVLIIPGNSTKPKDDKPDTKPDREQSNYTVKSGDFLSTIASRYGLRTSDLMRANNITNPDSLRVGQVLIIPGNSTKPKDDKPDTPTPTPTPIGSDRCAKKFHRVSRIILRHEGGYVNDPNDAGGKTNKGIAWRTWKKFARIDLGLAPTVANLKNLTDAQAEIIYRKRYWQPQGFCEIKNDRIGLMVYDWTITSGGAAKQVQRLLVNEFGQRIAVDGALGPNSIKALNNVSNQQQLLSRITAIRKDYYRMLARRRPANRKFLRGWLNRVNDCLEAHI